MKLFVYETVKCEVINVKFLSRDLPLNNSAIMVKWKCLKLLYSSKGMCRIDNQLKKVIRFEIFNSWNTLNLLLGINNNNFSFFGFSNLSFLCLLLQLSERKYFLKIFLALIWYCSKSKHFNITEKGLRLLNQLKKQCKFKQQPLRRGGQNLIQYFWEGGEPYMGGLGILWGNMITS